ADVAGIGTREEKEIVDDAGESASGVAHDGDRGAVRLFRAMRLRQRDVGFGANDRRRRAQLVRCVGHEAALQGERRLEPVEEAVDHLSEARDLLAAAYR